MSSAWRTTCAVACAFFGVRKNHDEQDAQLKPLHLIAAGLIGVFIFVLSLIALVHWIGKGG